MGEVEKLLVEYASKFAQASAEKRYKKVIELNTELSSKIANLSNPYDEIAQALEVLTTNPTHKNATLWLRAAEIHPSEKYLKSLCTVLEQENEYIWHEGILYILQKLKDEYSIPFLEKAINLNLDYDPYKHVAENALEALAKIGTPDAVEIIKKYIVSSDSQIREYAQVCIDWLTRHDKTAD